MKVLLISPKMEKPNGGIAIWTQYYEKGCQKREVEFDIVNTAKISTQRGLIGEIKRTRRIFKDLKKNLKEKKFDVAHLNTSIGVFGVIRDYLIAKKIAKKKIPIAVHFHCDIPFWVTNRVVKRYLKKLLNLSKKNFVLCENSRKYLERAFGVESIKVPNFIDENFVNDKREINEELKKALFVGRVSIEKGAKEMFEVARRFPDIIFEFIGQPSQEVLTIEKPENCVLLGPKPYDEVVASLDSADMFLFPSHSEGFSLALAEAMARGLPSVATDVGANLDMLENKGGLVVEKGDVDAMELCIKELLDPIKRKEMSKWCIEKVLNNYTTDKIIEEFLFHYNSL